jgi:hypothetical protein
MMANGDDDNRASNTKIDLSCYDQDFEITLGIEETVSRY